MPYSNKYTVNPLSLIANATGLGINDLLQYKPGVQILAAGDEFYNSLLYGGGFDGTKEFKLSEKAHFQPPQGIPIADRFCEFTADGGLDTYLIESPIIRVNRTKIINKTNVYGYDGTIKEFVALSDWMIDFTFFIYGKRRYELEYDELKDFLDLFNSNTTIDVNSPILQYVYDIDKVVIESINNIEEHSTYKNVMQVNMTLSSDEDYEPFSKTN